MLGLLLQNLREGCDELEDIHNSVKNLIDHPRLSSNWVEGIARNIYTTFTDLREWCDKFEKCVHHDNERQYHRKIESAEWIKAIVSDSMKKLVERASDQDISRQDGYVILDSFDEDLKAIARRIGAVKELDQLATDQKDARRSAIRQDHQDATSIEILFKDRLRLLDSVCRQKSFGIIERGCIGLDTMDWFWRTIPRPRGTEYPMDDKNRYDGVLITEQLVKRAHAVLGMFINAWILVCGEPCDRPSLDSMQDMSAIACVLYACGQHKLFNDFITYEIKDSTLDEGWEMFEAKIEHAVGKSKAAEVVGQFSRIKEKPWADGTHLKLALMEPLPLIERAKLRETRGPVGVYKVEDAWRPGTYYALKVVKTEATRDEQVNRLVNETNRLAELSKEDHGHHIIKCVKTYERGGRDSEIGILLLPVASSDLDGFLQRCCRDIKFRKQHRKDLMQAFGCLAYSLAYLHNVRDMRHRDMKPHNILVHYRLGCTSPDFILADFGLAFVFREQGFSGDENPHFGATPEYESPEVDPDQRGMHTRAADVFALGLVFLEIAWVLNLPPDEKVDQIGLRKSFWNNAERKYYKHYLPQINERIRKTSDRLAKSTNGANKMLSMFLDVAQKMIRSNPDDRLKIGDVVKELWSFKTSDFTTKPFCDNCTEKMKVDMSRRPKHANIFKHVPSTRDNVVRMPVRPRPLGASPRP